MSREHRRRELEHWWRGGLPLLDMLERAVAVWKWLLPAILGFVGRSNNGSQQKETKLYDKSEIPVIWSSVYWSGLLDSPLSLACRAACYIPSPLHVSAPKPVNQGKALLGKPLWTSLTKCCQWGSHGNQHGIHRQLWKGSQGICSSPSKAHSTTCQAYVESSDLGKPYVNRQV